MWVFHVEVEARIVLEVRDCSVLVVLSDRDITRICTVSSHLFLLLTGSTPDHSVRSSHTQNPSSSSHPPSPSS